jgi:hypothetical protein
MGLFRTPEQRFGALVVDEAKAAGVAEAWFDEPAFVVRWRREPGDDEGYINLHNIFRETSQSTRAERDARVRSLVASLLQAGISGTSWEEVRDRLRPVLRGVTFGTGEGAVKPLLSRPSLPFLVELVVVDRPTAMEYVTEDLAQGWDVPADEIFAAARANLATVAETLVHSRLGPVKTFLRLDDSGDNYFTSMLLLDDFLARVGERTDGRAVAFVPEKDCLIIGRDDPALIAQLLPTIEEQFRQAVRPLSPAPYTVDESGATVPYRSSSDGPADGLDDPVHRAEIMLAVSEYESQKAVLDARHERDGVDIFVASLVVASNSSSGRLFSVAIWSPAVDTYLPEADYVAFVDPLDMVPWAAVMSTVELEPVPGVAPPRYRVTDWPAAERMAQLRAQAVTP